MAARRQRQLAMTVSWFVRTKTQRLGSHRDRPLFKGKMMRKYMILALASVMMLQGCAGAVAIDATRKNTRSVVEPVMAQARPDLPAEAAGKCVAKAMTISETAMMGISDTTVITAKDREQVLEYAARPKAVACLAALAPVAPKA